MRRGRGEGRQIEIEGRAFAGHHTVNGLIAALSKPEEGRKGRHKRKTHKRKTTMPSSAPTRFLYPGKITYIDGKHPRIVMSKAIDRRGKPPTRYAEAEVSNMLFSGSGTCRGEGGIEERRRRTAKRVNETESGMSGKTNR
jgi:hypothetical protein